MREVNFLRKNLIAHRGDFNKEEGIPENSIPAFQRAIENGYSIELDVHLLKDNSVVVFHDDNLKRMTGVDKLIKNCTYDEIKNLKLDDTNYTIPLLQDVLNLVNGKVALLIETKYDTKPGLLDKKLVELLQQYRGNYAIQSFSPFSILWFKRKHPQIVRGQLAYSFRNERKSAIEKFLLRNLYFNFLTKPDFISYGIDSLPNKSVAKLKNKGMIVLGWTVKNEESLERAKKYCDNFICNNLDKIRTEYKSK